jgi:tRNA dimethylallyltransferase
MKKIPLIIILGPTACGKSSMGIRLAKKYNGEIVSIDSRQVYKGLDIGSGKVTKKEQKTVPHHLLDIIKPPTRMTLRVRHGGYFTLADFKKRADAVIADIWKRGKIPFLVGGTALYAQAVVDNYNIPEGNVNIALRKKLEAKKIAVLLKKLQKVDPITYKRIDHANKRRIIRAFEVWHATGKPFSFFQKKNESPYEPLFIGIQLSRKKLYERIDERVDDRMRQGMIQEVEHLLKKGVPAEWLESLGLEYRYITEYLKSSTSKHMTVFEEMVQKLTYAIHHFARRQLVWFRKEKRIHWISSLKEAKKLIENYLSLKE